MQCNVCTREGIKITEAKFVHFKGFEEFKFFYHKSVVSLEHNVYDLDMNYKVSEYTTGCWIAEGDTIQQAIARARRKLLIAGTSETQHAIEIGIKEHGVINA